MIIKRVRAMNFMKTTMLLAALTALFMVLGYSLGGSGGAIIALIVAAGMNLFTYWNADKIVLKMHNAVEVDASSHPEFYNMVKNLARRAGLPMPKVYIVDQAQPNAFATGRKKTFRRFLEAVFLCQQSVVLKCFTCLLGKAGMNLRGFAMAYRITEYGILVQGFALWLIIWEMKYNPLAIEEINSLASS